MAKLYNLARMTTTTTGTGTITLGSAVAGYLTFAQAGAQDGEVVDYAIKDGNDSEIGTGTYTSSGTTLTRTVTKSTNSDSPINLSGAAEVFITPRAETLDFGAFGFRNRIINPNGHIWQRLNSGSAAITDVTYAFDRWYGLTQSAGVTASQVTNAENGTPFMMRLTQANASAQRFGIAQAIEANNILDVRGKAVTLSARVRMSAATTLRYAIIEWTGTADTLTKDIVNDWTSTTFTPGNFFNASSLTIAANGSVALSANTLTSISLTGTVSGSMNNVIVFFWTDSTQAQNVTLDIGKVQLEVGSTATPLALRAFQQEILLCQRYYEKTYPLGAAPGTAYASAFGGDPLRTFVWTTGSYATVQRDFAVAKRSTPTVIVYSPFTGASGKMRDSNGGVDITATYSGNEFNAYCGADNVSVGAVNFVTCHIVAISEL